MKPVYLFILLFIMMQNNLQAQQVNPKLSRLITELDQQENQISDVRKAELIKLAHAINASVEDKGKADVVFICTHNSRRSQLSQVWLRTAAVILEIDNIHSYSGGTESTAFNHRMVAAIERAGFQVDQLDQTDNPTYSIGLSPQDQNNMRYFSKRYDDKYNPETGFIAVMVCSDADEACPLVEGAASRFSVPYLDPKAFDNTPEEATAYDEKVKEIGREILFLSKQLSL
jgi:protein-tyrosine-phosphatase